jgi:hypothetical protein
VEWQIRAFIWQTKSLLPCHFLDQVIDRDNHALSALRYLVMGLLRRQPTPRPPTPTADQEAEAARLRRSHSFGRIQIAGRLSGSCFPVYISLLCDTFRVIRFYPHAICGPRTDNESLSTRPWWPSPILHQEAISVTHSTPKSGNEWEGHTIDWLRERGKSWEEIAKGAYKPGGRGMWRLFFDE